MGLAVVKGLQGEPDNGKLKTLACAKHFAVHSGPEWSRHSYDAKDISPEYLWGTYLPAFEALVKGGVGQVMCAYNRYEGDPCCGSNRLLNHILREMWDYDGIVVSDCWALNDFYLPGYHETHKNGVEASAAAVMAGTDLECGPVFSNLKEAVGSGLVPEEKIDESLLRLLTARFALGEIDNDTSSKWSKIPYSVVDSKSHRDIALNMARKSMTLLKNNGILPLKKDIPVIVMGPNATDTVMQWGNYCGVPSHTVSLLDGIRTKNEKVKYIKGCDHVLNNSNYTSVFNKIKSNGTNGLTGVYFNMEDGQEEEKPVAEISYTMPLHFDTRGATVFSPGVNLENFRAVYNGQFVPVESGEYIFNMNSDGNGGYILKINGEQVLINFNETPLHKDFYVLEAEAGNTYDIEFLYIHRNGKANLAFDLGKSIEPDNDLSGAETIVFIGGISPAFEGEEMSVNLPGFRGGDRESIELPQIQRDFLKDLKSKGKKIVFVNCSGSALGLVPEDSICDAILQAWYPGEEGGQAVADVLFGDYNPAGRLPVTFYRDDTQLPDFEDYSMDQRTYRYMESKPLYPFGYGLSYTTFDYDEAIMPEKVKIGEDVPFRVKLRNNGDIDGEEVVQIYVKKKDELKGPKRSLRNFRRIPVKANSEVEVEFNLGEDTFKTFNPITEEMDTLPGEYIVYYGSSSDCNDYKVITLTE